MFSRNRPLLLYIKCFPHIQRKVNGRTENLMLAQAEVGRFVITYRRWHEDAERLTLADRRGHDIARMIGHRSHEGPYRVRWDKFFADDDINLLAFMTL